MSLNIYLYNSKVLTCDCGRVHEIETDKCVFDANITHNLGSMADAAGIGDCLWAPEKNGISKAKQLIEPLTKAILSMKALPDYYKQFNARNGWGLYDDFVPWLELLLYACIEYPESKIEISR
jgi:hypothetical protein